MQSRETAFSVKDAVMTAYTLKLKPLYCVYNLQSLIKSELYFCLCADFKTSLLYFMAFHIKPPPPT